MSSPAVSILLPFRNAATTLPDCLDSIGCQSFTDYEVVAVDDGSTDESAALVRARAAHDFRISLLRGVGSGLVPALNQGLRACRAPLVARMDADDLMLPDRLARQQAFLLRNTAIALVASRVALFPETRIRDGYREYLRWQDGCSSSRELADGIYVESPFAHPSVMFRRDAILGLGGYREGPFPEDYDLWLRLCHQGHRMAKLPETLLLWRESPGRTSRTDPRYGRAAFDELRAAYLARDPRIRDNRDRLVFWGAGRNTRKRAERLVRKGFPPLAWIDIDPRKIGNRIAGVAVESPDWLDRRPRPFVLSYVCNHGARELIAASLEELGFRRGLDYLMVG